jgi:hypothetical protein
MALTKLKDMSDFTIVPDGPARRGRTLYGVKKDGRLIVRETKLGDCREFVRLMDLHGYGTPIAVVMETLQ